VWDAPTWSTSTAPTHGFGSFCSSGAETGADDSTIAAERERNDALVAPDEDTFVEKLIANLTAYPAYYAHMGALNLQGPGPIDLSAPQMVDAEQLRQRLDADGWVVDLRSRVAYANEHVAGSIGIELGGQFSTYLGWLIPWGTPLTLLGESAEQVQAAQRQLVRIGIDRPDAAAVGSPADIVKNPEADLGSYERVTFDDLAGDAQRSAFTVLDVRRDDERADGAIPGSVHVPLHSLLQRMDVVPDGPLWVHCASGFRASVAVSILSRAGRDATLIDDEFAHAAELKLTWAPR
jgi:hydroxyacylglutathione hydrolase